MAVYKDKWNGYNNESWRVSVYYKDWKGEQKRHDKRGFKTKKEAVAYEREFLARNNKDINMGFDTFVDIYLGDLKPQIKASTYATKESVIDAHIRPYFKNKSLAEISSTDILQWQNELLSLRDDQGKGYSQTYLRSIQNKVKTREMLFWTKDEYLKFAEEMKEKPLSYYAFELLYWTGIRCGELLALTRDDFDLEKKTLRINKTFQTIKGKEMVTSPKTEKSNRRIDLPEFLCREMEDYFASLYKVDGKSRLFPVTKYYMHHELDRGCRKAGVKRIRIHDLRHSSCALLINLGYSPVQIAQRLGHESVTVTERYSHLYPSVQQEMAKKLDEAFSGEEANEE